ncbi:MAG: HDIG domain-containing protein [Clostridia bacterium]|nr:HDIG domain-containing protein [Clostridia bacterium]MCL6522173.1 HDIG domain-containing protein [Bacillota bacterium]
MPPAGESGPQSAGRAGKAFRRLAARLLPGRAGQRLLLAGGLWLVLAAVLAASSWPQSLVLRAGEVAPFTLKAPHDFVDVQATEKLRQEAASRVAPVMRRDPAVAARVLDRLRSDFQTVRQVRAQPLPLDRKETLLESELGLSTSAQALQEILTASDRTVDAVEQMLEQAVSRELDQQITQSNLGAYRSDLRLTAAQMDFTAGLRQFMADLGAARLEPNTFVDEARTRQAVQAARQAVPDQMILRGEVIVREGERVTPEQVTLLREAGLLRAVSPLDRLEVAGGAALWAALVVALLGYFLARFWPGVWRRLERLALLALILAGAVALALLLRPVSPLLAPLAGAAMLVTVTFDPMLGVVVTVLLGGVLAFVLSPQPALGAILGAGALAGVVSARRIRMRSDLLRAGGVVGLVQAAAALAVEGLLARAPLLGTGLWIDVLASAGGGLLLGGVVTIGMLPLAESFGILTPIRLMELANPDQPLLRLLLTQAPGTYHHSLMVANLAEAAAEAIGANGLLARVGAYYHDVGKVRRPYFFVENQFTGENPHDRLSPYLSALIVQAHVRDGLELAREYRLPEEIRAFIPEHHGTALVSYFYHRAASQAGSAPPEAQFRHSGPRPHSRETAIVMLADGSEAAVRSLEHPTPQHIEGMVRKIIQDRLADGQLDRSDLTLRDLDTIRETFVRVLTGAYHHRVEYPDNRMIEELEKGVGEGGRPGDGGAPRRGEARSGA